MLRHPMLLCILAVFLTACGAAETDKSTDTDVVDTDVADTDVAETCAVCDDNATCDDSGASISCTCDEGYEGDGRTCTDIDECLADNGGCDVNAVCANTDGSRTCTCEGFYEGDGETCTLWVDPERRACDALQAEHPSYTTIARDVALCGSRYDPTNIATACHTGWHVCLESEWLARYPTNRTYRDSPTDPDLIGPTLGLLTSWGASQADRCGGGVWQDCQPQTDEVYGGDVCHNPDATIDSYTGGAYLPQNDGKILFANDGTTLLHGLDADGEQNCCSWDVAFEPTELDNDFAVYCCLDE